MGVREITQAVPVTQGQDFVFRRGDKKPAEEETQSHLPDPDDVPANKNAYTTSLDLR